MAFIIRFTVAKDSIQRGYGKRTHLKSSTSTRSLFKVGHATSFGEKVLITVDEANRYDTYDEALEALLAYMREMRWDSGKQWVRNPRIIAVD